VKNKNQMKKHFTFHKTLLAIVLLITSVNANAIVINGLNYKLDTDKLTAGITSGQAETLSGTIIIPDTVTYLNMKFILNSITSDAFQNCSSITAFNVLKSSYFSSSDGILYNADKTQLICCPRGSSITTDTIPASVVTIGNFAFSNCANLTSVTIPNSVITIKGWAFGLCVNLSTVFIGDSISTIGDSAFFACSKLMSINIPNGIKKIGGNVFMGCSSLKSITIPNSVTSIGSQAFMECSGLTSVKIGNSVTSIGIGAFCICKNLAKITIPNSVVSIDNSAFSGCSQLAEVHCQAVTPPACTNDAFYYTNCQNGILFVPKGSKAKYANISPWKDFSLIMEEDITECKSINYNKEVYSVGQNLIIKGAEFGEIITVYTMEGELIKSFKVTGDEMNINLPASNIYLVKLIGRTVKIVM